MGAFYTYLLKKDIGFLFLSFISRIESKRRAFILVHNALLSYFIFYNSLCFLQSHIDIRTDIFFSQQFIKS